MNDAKSPSPGIAPPERLSTGDELYRSAEEFQVLFDLCPIAAYVINAAGVIVKFNDRATRLWGREPVLGDTDEKFCGSHQMYLLDGTPLRHDECPMAQVVSGAIEVAIDEQVVVERPDGSRVTVIVNIRPLRDSRGGIVGAINCFYELSRPISIPTFAKLQSPG
jgi:PAS domain S-box-containing protein